MTLTELLSRLGTYTSDLSRRTTLARSFGRSAAYRSSATSGGGMPGSRCAAVEAPADSGRPGAVEPCIQESAGRAWPAALTAEHPAAAGTVSRTAALTMARTRARPSQPVTKSPRNGSPWRPTTYASNLRTTGQYREYP